MRNFVFHLDTLLRHRKRLEEKERERLAWVHYRLENERRCLRELQSKHAEVRTEMAGLEPRNYDPAEVGWYCVFLNRLDRQMDQVQKRIVGLKSELERQMALWVERTKDRRVLEHLQEKKEHEHVLAMDRLEQKTVDELVVTRFAGNK